jgi:hypothetical protein
LFAGDEEFYGAVDFGSLCGGTCGVAVFVFGRWRDGFVAGRLIDRWRTRVQRRGVFEPRWL